MLPPPQIPDLVLLRRIGGGSYGEVWLARTVTGVYRAVKIVERGRFTDDRPFQRELDGITQFQRLVGDRPRQLALMHVGHDEAAGVLYYVMELADDVVTGTDIDPDRYTPLTLKTLRERQPHLPATECIRLGVELARSLVELHAAGLIHRDIKLSNVIFVGGVPKLADIGLVSSSDHTLTSLGTPGYAPPEGTGSASADLYGLGKVLYEMATGCPPAAFPRLPPEVQEREDVALLLELNEIVLRACDPQPQRRFASGGEMLDQLLLLQAGRSVKELQRTRQRLRALRRVAVAAVLLALAIAGVLGVQNYFNLRRLAAQEASARRRAEEDEHLARYSADLHRARVSLLTGDVGLARATLRRDLPQPGQPDFRGLEWNALWNETAGWPHHVLGTIGGTAIRSLALSPDGDFLVAQQGDTRRETVIWDLAGDTHRTLDTDTRGRSLFVPPGERLLTGSAAGPVSELDPATGRSTPLPGLTGRIQLQSDDGRLVVLSDPAGRQVRLQFWDTAARRVVATWQSALEAVPVWLTAVALGPDRRHLAVGLVRIGSTASDYELQVWRREEEGWAPVFSRRDLSDVHALRFSPDGSLLAAAGPETTLTLLDASTGRTRRQLSAHRGDVLALAFGADGLLASAGEDQTIRIWRVADGSLLATLRGHEAAVTSLVWREPSRLISGSIDGTIRIWDPMTPGPRLARPGFWTAFLGDFLYGPDGGSIVVTRADGRLGQIDAHTLQPTGLTWAAFHPLGFGRDGLHAMTSDYELVIGDLSTGAVQHTGLRPPASARIMVATGSSDGHWALLGMTDGNVQFWDCDQRRAVRAELRHHATIFGAAFSADAKLAATGDTNGAVWFWDPAKGRTIRGFLEDTSSVLCLTISAAGHVAIGRDDGSLTILEAATGRVLARRMAHSRGLNALAYSPDGSRLVTGGYDGVLLAWSVPEYREIGSLPIRTVDDRRQTLDPRPALLRFSPDGSQLTTFTESGWLRRWDLTPPERPE